MTLDASIVNKELADLLWSLYGKAIDQIEQIPLEYKREFVKHENGRKMPVIKPRYQSLMMPAGPWREYDEAEEIVANLIECDYFPASEEEIEDENNPVRGRIYNDVIDWLWQSYLEHSDVIGEHNREAFLDVFQDFEAYHRSDSVPFVAKAFLANFSLDEGEEVEIHPNLRIRDISVDDLNWLLENEDSLESVFGPRGVVGVIECEYDHDKTRVGTMDYPKGIFQKVVTALRLFKPRTTPGIVYSYAEPTPKYTGGQTVDSAIARSSDKIFYNSCELSKSECDDFAEFYNRNQQLIRTESNDGEYSRPLRRFNEMYQKPAVEDCIVDCAIAMEGTLLEPIQSSSFTFRLGLRGGILLDDRLPYSRSEMRSFLETLYFVRGEIVHSDFQMERILDKIENHANYELAILDSPTEREYVQEARVFLAAVLREYMEANVAHDISIADVNRKMDEAARNVTYTP
ncbi:hypothetical protein [Haladaptatus pallidirubidus]|uniref:Uncharacterized protein n=2 Tax=Haladaptatus pallidirubidus TaxID=1008152 RepID=A0AAV3UH86_9EURY|nr:hypothetical protein [Haladaptatus pallidirubidus]